MIFLVTLNVMRHWHRVGTFQADVASEKMKEVLIKRILQIRASVGRLIKTKKNKTKVFVVRILLKVYTVLKGIFL